MRFITRRLRDLSPFPRLNKAPPALQSAAMGVLMLLALTFGYELVDPLVDLGGFMVMTNVEIVLVLALGLWLLARIATRRWPAVPGPLVAPIVVWLLVLLISTLTAPSHRGEALKFLGRVLAGVLVAWAAYDVARTPARWRMLLRALALGGLGVALLGLAEAANILPTTEWLASFKHAPTYVGDVLRVSSSLPHANIASMVLEVTGPLLLAWVITARQPRVRTIMGFALLVTLLAQALTLSRGGLIATAAALALMLAVGARRAQRTIVVGSVTSAAVLMVILILVYVENPIVALRLTTRSDQGWYLATYRVPASMTARADETVSIPVLLTNTSVRTWQPLGSRPFALSYHVSRADGTLILFDGLRTPLPRAVPPGGTAQLQAQVIAPPVAGEYLLEWDMVQEGVTWFSFKGASPAHSLLSVAGEAPGAEPWAPEIRPAGTDVEAEAQVPGRLTLWQVSARMIRARPLLGVGPDNFRWVWGAYAGLDRWDTRLHANSQYIEWLTDTGVLGFLAFLWLAWTLFRTAFVGVNFCTKELEHELATWQLALVGSLTAWFVHGLFDYFYEFTPTYVAFWLIAGLSVARGPSARTAGAVLPTRTIQSLWRSLRR